MKAPIMEVFSSIQGEGLLMGRRQIFVRFAGCNLSCNYCDTPESRDASSGERVSVEELHETVKGLITPDFHSLSITGGEPLLYPEFIEEFLDGSPYSALLETNGSLPENARRIAHLFDHASVDIKTPEHFSEDTRGDSTKSDISWSRDIIDREIQVVNILISKGANTYCKVVVMPTTRADYIGIWLKGSVKTLMNQKNFQWSYSHAVPLEDGQETLLACWKCLRKPESIWMCM